MADQSYQGVIYTAHGGKEQVIPSGCVQRNQGLSFVAQPEPTVKTVANTMTIAELLTRIINATPTATGATAAYTLPTGASIDAGVTMDADDSFDWCVINNAAAAADTITITGDTGHTVVGNPVVQSLHASTGAVMGYSATFRTRKVSTGVFVTYRTA